MIIFDLLDKFFGFISACFSFLITPFIWLSGVPGISHIFSIISFLFSEIIINNLWGILALGITFIAGKIIILEPAQSLLTRGFSKQSMSEELLSFHRCEPMKVTKDLIDPAHKELVRFPMMKNGVFLAYLIIDYLKLSGIFTLTYPGLFLFGCSIQGAWVIETCQRKSVYPPNKPANMKIPRLTRAFYFFLAEMINYQIWGGIMHWGLVWWTTSTLSKL